MNEPQTFVDLQDAGNAQAQLILQAIARHTDWDSGECYPGQEALSRMAKCSTRSIRRYLIKLEADGFIARDERRKESGAKQSDLIVLVGYREWITALRDGGNVKKPKVAAAYEQAANLSASQAANLSAPPGQQVSAPPGQQVSANKGTSLNVKGTEDARAREGSNSNFGSAVSHVAISLTPTADAPEWRAWIEWLSTKGQADLVERALSSGQIITPSRWPKPDSPIPKIPDLTKSITKRMTGEAA